MEEGDMIQSWGVLKPLEWEVFVGGPTDSMDKIKWFVNLGKNVFIFTSF